MLLLALLGLVAAACGAAEETPLAELPGVAEPSSTTAPDGQTPATEAPGGEDPGAPAPSTTAGGGGGGESPPPETAPTTAAPSDEPPPAPGGVGAFAPYYLRPSASASLVLDVHSQPAATPRQGTLDHAAAVLGQVSGKRVQVPTGSLPGGARQWSADDIRALADEVGRPQSRDAAVITLLFLEGGFAESDRTVGVAVRSDVAAVFADRVDEAAGTLGNPAAVEDAVTIHELGHLLGLVDLFLDTGREDPEHPGHSRNTGSVMYYAVESTLLGTILSGGPPRDFDDADLADLAAIRAG